MAFKHHEIVSIIAHQVLFINRLNGLLEYKHNDEFFEEQVKNPIEKILKSKQLLNDEFYSKEEMQFVFMLLDKKLEEFKSKNIENHKSYLQTYENNEIVSKELSGIKNEIIELYIEWRNSFIEIKSHNGFILNHYSDGQLMKLCIALKENGYLNQNTEEANFVNAFNGSIINKKLEWIDLSKTRKKPNAQTIFQLLSSLGLELKNSETKTLDKQIKSIIEKIFDIKFSNLTSSHNEFKSINTQRQKELDNLISNLKS